MPIVGSKSAEIRRHLADLKDPRRRAAAVLRLRALASRVVPHAAAEIESVDADARTALIEVLLESDTKDARMLVARLRSAEAPKGGAARSRVVAADPKDEDAEFRALAELQKQPPPHSSEGPSISRNRGDAHLVLARLGSRLARKELAQCLGALPAARLRAYAEAAGLIGDPSFLESLAPIADSLPEASRAIAQIAGREGLTARSAVLRKLSPALRTAVGKAMTRG